MSKFTSEHVTGVLVGIFVLAFVGIITFGIYKTNELEVENNKTRASIQIEELNKASCYAKLRELQGKDEEPAVELEEKGNE